MIVILAVPFTAVAETVADTWNNQSYLEKLLVARGITSGLASASLFVYRWAQTAESSQREVDAAGLQAVFLGLSNFQSGGRDTLISAPTLVEQMDRYYEHPAAADRPYVLAIYDILMAFSR